MHNRLSFDSKIANIGIINYNIIGFQKFKNRMKKIFISFSLRNIYMIK
jgi:hypothetical protein